MPKQLSFLAHSKVLQTKDPIEYELVLEKEGGKRAHNFIDLTGKRYGKLFVSRYAGYFYSKRLNKRKAAWFARCDCGKDEIVLRGNDLRTGQTTSCGCHKAAIAREFNKRTKTRDIHDGFSQVHRGYMAGAKNRGFVFNLSRMEFFEITQKDCVYCGQAPSMNRKSRIKGKPTSFVYNGIDRVNPKQGYIIENCVPCCGECNFIKSDFGLEEFMKRIEKILSRKDFIYKTCRRTSTND